MDMQGEQLALDASTLLARAKALLPGIAARSAAAVAQRDLPAETVAEIGAAGLFRAFQPARWGGLELDPRTVLDIQNVFASTCVSTAWIYGVLTVQSFVLSRFDERAQADVWGADPRALVSSSFGPVGKVTPVEGGFRISGRYTFSSGSTHCGWALVGGMVPPPPGQTAPQMRLFLVPRKDYVIDDVWHTIGLQATGSNDLLLEDVFVPEYRTYAPDGGMLPLDGSSGLKPLYRLPWLHLFTSMISNLGVGAARGALAAFVEAARTRQSFGKSSAENPAFLSVIARVRAETDIADLVAKRNLARYLECVDADETMTMAETLTYRAQLTSSMRKMAALVDEMMLLLGGRGIQVNGPITRFWLDVMAARAHMGNDPANVLTPLANETLAGR